MIKMSEGSDGFNFYRVRCYHTLSGCFEVENIDFAGDGSPKKFNKDVREVVVQVLEEEFNIIEYMEGVYVRKKTLKCKNEIDKLVKYIRENRKLSGSIYVTTSDGCRLLFYTPGYGSFVESLDDVGIKATFELTAMSVTPCDVFKSNRFLELMKERGWKRINLSPVEELTFYGDGDVFKMNGTWYNEQEDGCILNINEWKEECPDDDD